MLSIEDAAIIAGLSGLVAFLSMLPGLPIGLPDEVVASEGERSVFEAAKLEVPDGLRCAAEDRRNDDGGRETRPESPPPLKTKVLATSATDGLVPPVPLSPQAIAIERIGQAFLVGLLIRIVGTVAFFLISSYYLRSSATVIGICFLGWHWILMHTEVIALARCLRAPSDSRQ